MLFRIVMLFLSCLFIGWDMNCELKKFSNNMISTKLYAVPGKLFTVSIPEEQIGKVMVSYQYDLYLVPICVHFCFTTYYFVSFKTFKYLI